MKLKDYLREHSNVIFMSLLVAVTFFVTFSLLHLPVKAVIYPVLLSLVLCILFASIDFMSKKRKYEKLQQIKLELCEQSYNFTGAESKMEEIYQEMITLVLGKLADHTFQSNEKYSQMMDYYTMWVHQIKTPIASMRLILEGMDSAEARKLTAELFRIEQYVNMVLTYLRLDSDSSDYVLKEYSVDELVKPVIRKFSSEFIGKKLSFSYEETQKTLVTDEKWFGFVVEQVLSNALKYTKQGGIRIYTEEAFLVIEDTGIGIALEDLPRIFEKGFTGFNGRMDRRASGIGLFLCKRICDKLQLPIVAESEVSKGTRIKIGVKQNTVYTRD